jgi:hypothetical protein
MILSHSRFSEFTVEDFHQMTEDLSSRVRCYG